MKKKRHTRLQSLIRTLLFIFAQHRRHHAMAGNAKTESEFQKLFVFAARFRFEFVFHFISNFGNLILRGRRGRGAHIIQHENLQRFINQCYLYFLRFPAVASGEWLAGSAKTEMLSCWQGWTRVCVSCVHVSYPLCIQLLCTSYTIREDGL